MTLPMGLDECHPDRDAILAAVFQWEPMSDPILLCIGQLTTLHERRNAGDTSATIDIARTIARVDAWIAVHYRTVSATADLHTETLGSALDRLASYSAEIHSGQHDLLRLESAWNRVDELANACAQLLDDVVHGFRRLPRSLAIMAPSRLFPDATECP